MDPLIGRMESGLRLKILSPTRRKDFFAHLKGAQQVHFANKIAEPGKCRVTSIHPSPGVGHVHRSDTAKGSAVASESVWAASASASASKSERAPAQRWALASAKL